MIGSTRTMRPRRAVSAVGAVGAVAALALAGCGTQVAGGGSEPPLLRIGAASAATAADAASGGRARAAGSGITLDGSLPAGPAEAAVRRPDPGRTPQEQVRALAESLGLAAAPVRHAHGWEVTGTGPVLRVRDDGGEWSYSRSGLECPAYLVDLDSSDAVSATSCAGAAADGPTPGLPVPDDAAALAAAAPVLAAGGTLGEPRAVEYARGLQRTVVVDPVVDGQPTSGMPTLLDVDRDGIAAGYGRLGSTTQGARYPLVSARSAYDSLAAEPRVMPELACLEARDGRTVCPEPEPVVVTGAVLGLELAVDDTGEVLVPAWLFTVRGSADPLVSVAVQPQYLAEPSSGPSTRPGSGGAEPGSSGSGGGTDPAPSTPGTEPGPPGDSDGAGPSGTAIRAARVSADGLTLTLTGTGGICATYAGTAVEDSATVTVQILGTSTLAPDEACAAMAVEVVVRVTLDAPLGTRSVRDATTGDAVALAR